MKKFFRFILLIVNLVFAVAMLLSTLSGTLAPSHFAWISILSYGYFILLLSNVLFVIIWLCMGRWEFLVSVVAIVLRFSFVGLFFQVGGCRGVEAADDNMKVLSFNTHGFNGLDSDTLMTADSGAMLFLHILDEEQPDVLCLQEFFPPSRFGIVDSFEVRGYKYFYGCKGNTSYSPAIIFSRCPIVGVHNMDERSKFNIDIEKNGKIVSKTYFTQNIQTSKDNAYIKLDIDQIQWKCEDASPSLSSFQYVFYTTEQYESYLYKTSGLVKNYMSVNQSDYIGKGKLTALKAICNNFFTSGEKIIEEKKDEVPDDKKYKS